mmetsp:Transcript_55361/g.134447  ORF Transcript_55361/g.134447 Transcript_55361/m.134447 type:complete len:168 (-) Transcript_55361:412-915(-)
MTRLALPFLGFLIYCAVAASAFQAGHIHRHHPQRQPRGGSTTSQSPVEASLPSSSETHARSTGMGKTRLYAAKKKSKAADVETLRKKELVGMVSESTGLPKSQVETVISGLLDSIVEVRSEFLNLLWSVASFVFFRGAVSMCVCIYIKSDLTVILFCSNFTHMPTYL